MSELAFLLDLLLEHRLPKATQVVVKERIKEVEGKATQANYNQPYIPPPTNAARNVPKTQQSASTQKILDEMAKEGKVLPGASQEAPLEPPGAPPEAPPVVQVAQTAQTAAAMQARQQAIAMAASGKEEKGRTSPRKF